MKPRKPNETDEQYIRRLETANATLRQNNKATDKWAATISRAVTILACEGSLAFQAMAEKARVRSHPSVTKAVELFDFIAHPQWTREQETPPEVEWPKEWDFDAPDAWSGDADMQLNAPIALAIEYLESRKFKSAKGEWEHVAEIIAGLEKVLRGRVEGIKEGVGFTAKAITLPTAEHYRDLSREDLVELISAMGWMALDLAQDMAFANECLRRDLRAATYRRVCHDLYRLSFIDTNEPPGKIDVKVLGAEEHPF